MTEFKAKKKTRTSVNETDKAFLLLLLLSFPPLSNLMCGQQLAAVAWQQQNVDLRGNVQFLHKYLCEVKPQVHICHHFYLMFWGVSESSEDMDFVLQNSF